MRGAIIRTVLFLLVVAGLAGPAAAKRVALVIGNSAYEQVAPLKNPKNDADALAAVLKRLDFKVIKGIDLDRSRFEETVRRFARAIRGADVALLFYAGHGLQVHGRNYLAPVDATLTDEADLVFETLKLEDVLAQMERESRVNLVFLDACRDNPMARNLARSMGTRSASVGRGLARVDTGVGTLIAFATEPGNVALDGTGSNSPFTEALLKHIETPNLDIARLMRRVRKEVLDKTAGKQVPWSNSSLTGDFVFAARQITVDAGPGTKPRPVVKGPAKADAKSIELAYWDSVKDSASPGAFESYIKRFPGGVFSDLARIKIQELKQRKKTVNVAPSRPTVAATPDARKFYDKGSAFHNADNHAEAFPLFKQAAELGHVESMFSVGAYLDRGAGVAKNDREAVRWYRRAADKGHVSAMYNLAIKYRKGDGIGKDAWEAVHWYRKAANRGHAKAMYSLGILYERGVGITKDPREAVHWYRKAANKGFASAMHNLGNMYENGAGVARNSTEAAKWVFKALENADAFALKQMTGNSEAWSRTFRLEIQRLMKGKGVYSGPIDGRFGSGTKRALKALATK